MADHSTCLKCGAPLTRDSRERACSKCLLGQALLVEATDMAAAAPEEAALSPAAPVGSCLPNDPAPKTGDRIGRYKILQEIGHGGCGVVYMAEQEEPVRRRVALKIIKLGMDTTEVVARFEAERQALALMDHPNIARVFDGGATPTGRPFFVMELVRGIRITDFCDQSHYSTRQRLELFMQVCHAVQHAHQKGVIHRDLKPSNILVTINDGAPVPKIIDFGIAKATEQRLTDKTVFTRFHEIIGTPAYMSPEQAEMTSLDIDTRSDIYSLGVLLYQLLTDRTPFDAKELLEAGVVEMRRTIREKEPLRPSTRLGMMIETERTTTAKRRGVDAPKLINLLRGDLDWIVMKCLEKDRARRFETANGLALDIAHYLKNEPVSARPPSTFYRFQKLVRRHRGPVIATAAVAASLVMGATVSTILFVREKAARQQAMNAEHDQFKLRQLAEAARNNEATLRTQAEASEKLARAQASKSQQVAQFLEEMLQGVGPSVALGRDTTLLREILQRTAARLSEDLKEQPEVQADLRNTLAGVYHALGEYEKAEAMHREALAARHALPGNKPLDTAASLSGLAVTLWREGKLAEAEALHRQAQVMYRNLQGDEHISVATSLHNLALVLRSQTRLAEAETAQREALALKKKLLGHEHASVAASLSSLASILNEQGQRAEAEALYREALAMYRQLLGGEHPHVATSLHDLAEVLRQQGKRAEAETFHREALAMYRKLLGHEHPNVATSLHNLAHVLRHDGQLVEAEAMHREALAIRRKLLGSRHPSVANSLNNLATVLRDQGQLAEAETLFRESLAIYRKLFGSEHPNFATSLDNLASTLERQGKLAEARELFRERLDGARRQFGPESRETSDALEDFSTLLLRQEKFVDAEPLARECLSIREKLKPASPRALYARSLFGASLLGQKRYTEAEPLLLAAFEGMEQQSDQVPAHQLQQTLQSLVRSYEAKGKPIPAEWKERLEQWQKAPTAASPPGRTP